MLSSKEIDYLIATRVMGCPSDDYPSTPEYSSDIYLAWQVAGRLYPWREQHFVLYAIDGEFTAILGDVRSRRFAGKASNAPLAICIAALRAVGVEVE